MTTSWWFVLFSAAFLPAQDPASPPAPAGVPVPGASTSAAEQQFRDAWWAESGRNDLDAALRGYLAAVIADGPSAVRAKAMLAAGRIQQRQGRTEPALASFRRVVSEFASETESVAAARTHLRELTAVDLRQNYDEWYERRLFSEDVQLLILGKLEALSSQLSRQFSDAALQRESQAQRALLRGEILAFGKGASPALRKAARGRHEALASAAIDMLFELGEVPPVEALVANGDWADEVGAWRQLLRTPVAVPKTAVTGWYVPFVAASGRGPGAVVELLLQPELRDHEAMVGMIAALFTIESVRERLLATLGDQDSALALRDTIAQALQRSVVVLTSAEWMQAARDPLRGSLQVYAVQQATSRLASAQGEQLDELLRLVAASRQDAATEPLLADAFLGGLENNSQVERLPWTRERLQAVVAVRGFANQPLPAVMLKLRRNDRTRAMLAEAMLVDPLPVVAGLRGQEGDELAQNRLRESFGDYEESEASVRAFRRLWHDTLFATLTTNWPLYDEAKQLAAIVLVDGMTNPSGDRSVLQEFLRRQASGASGAVKAAMAPLLEPGRN